MISFLSTATYTEDIPVTRSTTIFETSKTQIKLVDYFNFTDQIENEIIAARWKIFVLVIRFKR